MVKVSNAYTSLSLIKLIYKFIVKGPDPRMIDRLLVRCWDSPHLGIGVVCEVVAQGELQWGDCLCSITCMAFLELLPYYARCRDVGCAAEDGDDFVGCNITFSHEAFGVRVRVPALRPSPVPSNAC